jgi:hypothetical protein
MKIHTRAVLMFEKFSIGYATDVIKVGARLVY